MDPSSFTLAGSADTVRQLAPPTRCRLPCLVSHEHEVSSAVMEEMQEVQQQEE
jgi:hypothetical protein